MNEPIDPLDEDDVAPPPALDFDAWATLSARLLDRKGDDRAAVLKEAELDETVWDRCDAHYTGVLTGDIRQGDLTRASLYGSRCAEEQRRRAEAKVARVTPASRVGAPSPSATIDLSVRDESPFATLPFKEGGVSPLATARTPSPKTRAADDLGSTAPLTQAATEAPLPFAALEPGVAMTLEQYSSFRAELGVFPEKELEVLAKYGLSDQTVRRALDEHWRKRFAKDRPAQKRFLELSTKYRDWLLAQGVR